jgi:hypothetical protein
MERIMNVQRLVLIFYALAACLLAAPCVGQIPAPAVKDPTALLGNELARIDMLILATQQSLESQKKLREQIAEYQKIQEYYLKHSQDNEVLFRMIKIAYATLNTIKDNHLEQTFDPDFISELTVISQVAKKRGVPKP